MLCGLQLLVARLPQIKLLNSSEVRPREREDAEKAYVQRCRQEFLAAAGIETAATDAELFGASRIMGYLSLGPIEKILWFL